MTEDITTDHYIFLHRLIVVITPIVYEMYLLQVLVNPRTVVIMTRTLTT